MNQFLKDLDVTDIRDFVSIALFIGAIAVGAALGAGA